MIKTKQRNNDFVNVVSRIIGEKRGGYVSVGFAVRKAIRTEAPSLYLSEEYVYKRLHERRRSIPLCERPQRRLMWDEVERAVAERLRLCPDESERRAVEWVVSCYRPSGFFISEAYGRRLYYNHLWRTGKFPKLR